MEYRPTILTGGDTRSDDQIIAAHNKSVRRVSGPTLPGAEDSPLVIMELLQRLRVKDVMRSRNIISVVRTDSMRFAQNLMKRNNISGVPVLENKRLFGILSANDWPGQHPMVEYLLFTGAAGYYGFYYSPDDVPLAFQNVPVPLTETADGWQWQGKGDNRGITRRLSPQWFFFEAHF